MSEQFNFTEAFNSQTMRGRANVAKATWASVGLVYVLVKMHRRNSKRREAKLYCKGCQQALLHG
ncbi:putative 60S ribosomal protein L33 [Drosophila eugracilis]|uniref:putative 60S ribosomal protein L33 n=1 Tax=Drosophila eugracilis TaxID=29029 RepID=UPI0007E78A7D|nr:putative 60S ribosomal protein L33 [Drosophila eugracilis]